MNKIIKYNGKHSFIKLKKASHVAKAYISRMHHMPLMAQW